MELLNTKNQWSIISKIITQRDTQTVEGRKTLSRNERKKIGTNVPEIRSKLSYFRKTDKTNPRQRIV